MTSAGAASMRTSGYITAMPTSDNGDSAIGRMAPRITSGLGASRAEASLGAIRPIAESPLSDVGIAVMYPDVRIEAAPAEVIVTDHFYVEGFTGIGTAAIGSRA